MILDFSSFTRMGLIVDRVSPAEASGGQSTERAEGARPEGRGKQEIRDYQPLIHKAKSPKKKKIFSKPLVVTILEINNSN